MKLSIFQEVHEVRSLARLRELMASQLSEPYSAFWLHGADGQAISLLVNGGRACMFFIRENGDSGLTAHAPFHLDTTSPVVDFLIDNGQRDEYPEAIVFDVDEAVRAFESFFETGGLPPSVSWHES